MIIIIIILYINGYIKRSNYTPNTPTLLKNMRAVFCKKTPTPTLVVRKTERIYHGSHRGIDKYNVYNSRVPIVANNGKKTLSGVRLVCRAQLGPPWDMQAFKDWAALERLGSHLDDDDEMFQTVGRFEQIYYSVSVAYWGILLASILSGNAILTKLGQFKIFVSLMCAASFAFTTWFAARCLKDIRTHADSTNVDGDLSGFYRYGWRFLFWLGFVLFYILPTYPSMANMLAIPGAVMCLYGMVLVASSALIVGTWSFMGDPNVPMRLITVGPYSLLRHPQALGNMLFVTGFAIAGGSLWSALAFIASFAFYRAHIIPLEEQMLLEAYPSSYSHYMQRVPAFSGALMLLLVIQAALMWRFGFQ